MNLLIVSATPYEIAPLVGWLREHFQTGEQNTFSKDNLKVQLLITGVGLTHTAFAMGRYLSAQRPNLAINIGVAGAFNRRLKLGEVVNVVSECFGDLGVEEADGQFTSVHQLGLIDGDKGAFRNGQLHNDGPDHYSFLPRVRGMSVNKVHGYSPSIEQVKKQYQVEVESMEGAAFFYACLMEGIPFLEVRAISNYVESRNRERWKLSLAIDNLCRVMVQMIGSLD
ncbi:MAG: futalosine hydrolase [Bacteroidota bacterium]